MATSQFPGNPLTIQTATAGALTGDGTSGSKLAVAVDGASISVNGSNQLAVVGTAVPSPGLDTQVLFNDGGVDGADSGLTYLKATNTLLADRAEIGNWPNGEADLITLFVENETTVTTNSVQGLFNRVRLNPTGNFNHTAIGISGIVRAADGTFTYGDYTAALADPADTTFLVGSQASVYYRSNGNAGMIDGFYCDLENLGTADVAWMVGRWNFIYNADSGAIANAVGDYFVAPVKDGTGAYTNIFNTYSQDLSVSLATNPYYFWADSRGVFRIREDATFDSVGQAIPALYNPQFTKYTPGATNHERIVMGQWNGNVAEIGTEKGGTGTLRPLRLIGASVELPALTTATAIKTDTTTAHTALFQAYDVDGTAYKTFATLTNGNTPSFVIAPPSGGTVSLKGTLATAENASTGLVAGTLAALTNASIVITDGTGQVYRVPCVI